MEGPWSKDQVVGDSGGDAPWLKDQPTEPHGLVVAGAPAKPFDATGLPMPASAGYDQPAPAPEPPADPNRQLSLDLTAADKGLVADTLGAPVDLAAAALNGGSYLTNVIAKLFGSKNDVTPYVNNPAGGSQSISALGGQANKLLTGHDVPAPETPAERVRYNTVELGGNAAATEGFSPLLRAILNAARVNEVAGPTVTSSPLFRGGEPPLAPNPTTVTKAAVAGAGAGAVQGVDQEYTPDAVKKMPIVGPLLDLAAAGVGGIGGHGLANAGEAATTLATAPARRAIDVAMGGEKKGGFTLQDGTKATAKDLNAAAQVAQNTATDPLKAKTAIAETSNQLKAQGPVLPTTGAMSADPGAVGLEQKLRMDPNYRPAFVQRDQQVQQAARGAAEEIAPSTAVGRTFTDAADDIAARDVQNAAPVATAKGTGPAASIALDTNIKDTLRAAQDRKNSAFSEIDPNGDVERPVAPLQEVAKGVKEDAGPLASSASVPDDLISRINSAAGEEGDGTVSFKDINALRPEITARIAEAQKAGNYPLADNLRTIKGAIEDDVANLANEGSDAGKRAQAALDIYKNEFAPIWNAGPGDAATKFRKDFNVDRGAQTTTPPSQTASRFMQPGQPEKAQSLKKIIDSSATPGEGRKAASDYLMADLADSGATGSSGKLDAQSIKNWETKWGSTLDTVPGFRAQLDGIKKLADEAAQNEKAFAHVTGKSPSNAVASIFSGGDPERTVAEIMGKIGKGSAAHDGLKASIREYLIEKGTTSALQKTTTGDNPLSFAKLDTLFKQNEKTLSQVFSPKEMASLQAAHKFLASLKNLEQQSLAGSATAERTGLGDKMWRVVEIGLKTLHGGLRGGNEVRNLKLAAALQGGGPDQVAKLLVEMQFNPELAMHLFGRDVPKQGNTKFDQKLFNRLVLSSAVARNSVEKN